MYSSNQLTQAMGSRREERRVYIFIGAATMFFVAIVAPYRGVHLPQALLLSGAMILALFCLKSAVEDYDKLLLLFTIYAPFQRVLAGDFNQLMDAFNLTNLLGFFLLLGWMSRSFMRSESVYRRTALDLPLVAFMLLSSISVIRGGLISSDKSVILSVFELKRWLMPMIVYFIVFNNIRSERTIRFLVVAVCVTTAFWGFLGLKEFYMDAGGASGHVGSDVRIEGNSGQPNNFGAFFCYYTFLLIAFWGFNLRHAKAWLLALPVMACTRSMLLTFSRGAQVAFFVGIMVFTLLRSKRVFLFLFVPMIVFFAYNPGSIPGILVGRMDNTVDKDGNLDSSSDGRLLIWKGSLGLMRDYPLWGVGFGNFTKYIGDPKYGTYKYLDAHNIYIKVAAEMGLIAFAAFAIVLAIIMYKGLYVYILAETKFQRIVAAGFVAGYAAMLTANMFGSRLKSNEIVFQFWILTAVIMKMAAVIKENRQRKIEEAMERWKEDSGYST